MLTKLLRPLFAMGARSHSCDLLRNHPAGETLRAGDWVKVTHRIQGHNRGSDFLRLEDGRGFVFIESRSLDGERPGVGRLRVQA